MALAYGPCCLLWPYPVALRAGGWKHGLPILVHFHEAKSGEDHAYQFEGPLLVSERG